MSLCQRTRGSHTRAQTADPLPLNTAGSLTCSCSSSNSMGGDFLARLFFLLLLGLGCSNGGRCQAQTLLPQQEVEALKGIASKLNKTDWDFSVDPCSASGNWVNSTGFLISNVTCDCSFKDHTECHIISLQLMRQNLSGVLPDEVVNLTYLRYLDLSRNFIQGPIPASWANLPIFNLSLQGNRISGTLPKELGRMPMLKSMQLEGNWIEGPIPPELGNIISLERFFISTNNITGELPSTFSRLTNMTDFRIDGNNISGKIPSFIKNWQRVNRIDMQGTLMSGPIPPEISLLNNLTELRVTDLSGPGMKFPPLQNAPHLTEVVLRNCSIYGEIPSYLGQMQYLKVLDISFNMLTGQIPANFGGMAALQYLNMVSSFSSSNDNSLQPCLRRNLPCMGKSRYSSLFINCGGKSVAINGTTYKDDSSQIGTSIFVLSDDRKWAYSSTGDFVGNENADYIARNTSKLTLAHPELYTEARLSPLSLKYYGLCMENGEYMVKLHFAEIVFTEDHTYSSNGKRIFDVFIQGAKVLKDFNIQDEAGGVGHAITKNFTATVTDNTLEIHFYWGGKGTTAIPYRGVYGPLISAISVTQKSRNRHGVSTGVVIAIIAASCLAFVLLLIACYIKVFPKKNPKGSGRQFFYHGRKTKTSELQTRAQYFFSLKEIESATKHFDPSNKIGEGGFGPVYKGTLADGTTVAVKKLSSKSSQGNREFLNEIGIISALRHPNLVRLFGCCIDGDQLLLIYEFLENNSLGRALFGRAEHQLKLDWPTRYNICLGTARGLVYLHEESTLKIVHRDIKPSNILLDENMQPKISDFGLAKLNDDCGRVSTRLAGTVGYMAPEYATRGCLTRKADVYSYGVVTLEIVSGMSNTNSMSNEEYLHLLDWAERLKQQGRLLDIVDRRLGSEYLQEQALRLLNVALLCTKTLPTERPRMSSVVKMLCGQVPIEVVPDDDLIEDLRFNISQSYHSVNNSQTDWTHAASSDPSILQHNSKDSGYLPSSSSPSLKL
ncbi:probable LRR receptor-like serine/threonine-protein kinase At1g53430 isoform X2 [Phragmites australis]|uniref:probable LRR receptor-like serine/threonine-protein kinase At1g53430 isoform X2 n=1 Tax=Phragmites australis TaxID=29695 RepID=UPI002D79B275|nr:probable LRR receptor-like serine/threonine-protein kinase At1g53430 isoform X2 [Phragmites australis]